MNELYLRNGRVNVLKNRAKRCVCKYCGNKLSVKRIIFSDYEDARIEIYCEHCDRLEYGIEPQLYESAKRFVENMDVNMYPDMENNEQTKRMNIAKICEIMAWGFNDLAFMDENGFKVELPECDHHLEDCVELSDEEVPEEETIHGNNHRDGSVVL